MKEYPRAGIAAPLGGNFAPQSHETSDGVSLSRIAGAI